MFGLSSSPFLHLELESRIFTLNSHTIRNFHKTKLMHLLIVKSAQDIDMLYTVKAVRMNMVKSFVYTGEAISWLLIILLHHGAMTPITNEIQCWRLRTFEFWVENLGFWTSSELMRTRTTTTSWPHYVVRSKWNWEQWGSWRKPDWIHFVHQTNILKKSNIWIWLYEIIWYLNYGKSLPKLWDNLPARCWNKPTLNARIRTHCSSFQTGSVKRCSIGEHTQHKYMKIWYQSLWTTKSLNQFRFRQIECPWQIGEVPVDEVGLPVSVWMNICCLGICCRLLHQEIFPNASVMHPPKFSVYT